MDFNLRLLITIKGAVFSSGNDLTQNFELPEEGSMHAPLLYMIQAFIRFPKLLVGIINGPAIGIGATMIALCDILYASETAYFYTPFTSLGLCPEGCSSVTFPKILGTSKANEMLMLNHKMSVHEALQFGFISSIYKNIQEVWEKLEQIQNLPLGSIIKSKMLTRKFTVHELEAANNTEIEHLEERMLSEEALNALLRYRGSRPKQSKL